jgi:hypothetical protein
MGRNEMSPANIQSMLDVLSNLQSSFGIKNRGSMGKRNRHRYRSFYALSANKKQFIFLSVFFSSGCIFVAGINAKNCRGEPI